MLSETIERLGLYAKTPGMLPNDLEVDQEIHFTALDAHPWDDRSGDRVGAPLTADDFDVNGGVIDQAVVCWENVADADNYWQKGLESLNGLPSIPGCEDDFDLSLKSKMDHSAVHAWYYGTVDHTAQTDGAGIDIESDWHPNTERASLGFNFSRSVSGDIDSVRTQNTVSISKDLTLTSSKFFNGDFRLAASDKAIPGWEHQGGGGNGLTDSNFDWFNPHLRLDFGNDSRRHNKSYVPVSADNIWYRMRVVNKSSDDILEVRVGNQLMHAENVRNRTSYEWRSIDATPYRSETKTIEFKIRDGGSSGTVNSTVLIDDLSLRRQEYISAIVAGPIFLHAFDSNDNHTGPASDTTWVTDIPGSTYLPENDSSRIMKQTIILPEAPDGVTYRFQIESKNVIGHFSLQIEDVTINTQTISVFFDSIAIEPNSIASCSVNDSLKSSILALDIDGNGIFESTIPPTRQLQNFRIIATAEMHGSISPSDTIVVLLSNSLTFSISPEDGYQISDVLVDGHSAGGVSSYSFFAVSANHTIHARFSQASARYVQAFPTAFFLSLSNHSTRMFTLKNALVKIMPKKPSTLSGLY